MRLSFITTTSNDLFRLVVAMQERCVRARYAGIIALLALFTPVSGEYVQAVGMADGSNSGEGKGFTLDNPIKYDSIDDLIKAGTTIIMRLLLILAVLYFIYAGFLYVTALDDEGKLESARKSLVNAAIGTAILVSLNLILELIKGTFRAVGVQGI